MKRAALWRRALGRVPPSLLALAGVGCGTALRHPPPVASDAPSQTATGSQTLEVAVSGDFPSLDPARAQDTESISAIQLMYEPLFSYDGQGQVVGRLARSWNWSAGGTVLTVALDPAARFADGTPVLASDVVFSLRRMLDKDTNAPHAQSFSALAGFDSLRAGDASTAGGITASDPHTVVFTLSSPAPYLPELLALPSASVVEQQLAATAAATAAAWWLSHSAGSGPYALGQSTPGVSLELTPNAHYWRKGVQTADGTEGPFLPIEFRIISSPAQQLRQFESGHLDILAAPDLGLLAAGQDPPDGSHLLQAGNQGLAYLGFNVKKAPFDNLLVRQAVAYALDKTALLAAAGGVGQVAGGIVPPGVPGYDAALAPYPYDPPRAQALFNQAGLASGTPITLLTIDASGTVQQGMTDQAATLVKTELEAVGFSVTVLKDSWDDYYRDLGQGRANLFQAQWIADYPDPQDFLFNLLDSVTAGAGNYSFYADPAFDASLSAAATTADSATRVGRYRLLQAQAYQQLPILPEFYTDAAVLVQPWVRPDGPAAFSVLLAPPLLPQLDRIWKVAQTGG